MVVVWVRVPDLPVSVIVAVPALAELEADMVRFWAAPGVRVSVDGLAVTPEGNPFTDAVTLEVKPFSALAVTETDFPAAPAVKLRVAGAAVSEKSGDGAVAVIVRAMVAIWVRVPDLPVSVIVAVPALAELEADSVRVWARPGVSVSVDGLAVTPAGNPLRDTLTLEVKPFSALAVTETDFPDAPAVRLRSVGTAVSEKSGPGAAALMVSATGAV